MNKWSWFHFPNRTDCIFFEQKTSICSWSSPLKSTHERVCFSSHLLLIGCLFSLSLKCCLTVPIYDNRPLIEYRNICSVTIRAESCSLSQALHVQFLCFFSNSLQEDEESQPPADWLIPGGRGLRGRWSRAREGCQMRQKLMTEKRKWQIQNFLYWHRSSGGKTQL